MPSISTSLVVESLSSATLEASFTSTGSVGVNVSVRSWTVRVPGAEERRHSMTTSSVPSGVTTTAKLP